MSQPALAAVKEFPQLQPESLAGDCRLAVQSIRPIDDSEPQAGDAWFEFLIRPCGVYANFKPIDYVRMVYNSPFGLELDNMVSSMVIDWLKRQSNPYRASINIHPGSLVRSSFTDRLIEELDRAGIPGRHICLELVEFASMVSIDKAMASIEKLKAAGVKLAIDDYGRGMPCFEFYGAGVIDFIKVDRAYVKDICSHPGYASLLKGIVSMAKELQADVVAEGVEHEDQLELLTKIGVPWAQGYLFDRPRMIRV